jgi:hypothetical protein
MARAKRKTIEQLEAERKRLNKRIAAERKAQQEELDKATLAAVRRWAKTYKGGQKPEDLPALFNGWADRNESTQR